MSHDFKRLYLLNGASYAIFHEHIVDHIQYMVFQFTSLHLTLGGIEWSNQGQFGVHWAVYHTQCIIRQRNC